MVFKKFLALFLIISFLATVGFQFLEGDVVLAASSAATTTVNLTVTGGLTMNCSSSLNLGSISGITGGVVSSTFQCNVVDNNSSGFSMTIKATNTPAMSNATNSFPDYATTSDPVDYDWTVMAATSGFGYTVSSSVSADAATAFKNNGSACNQGGGSNDGIHCFAGFTTVAKTIINRSSASGASGENEVIRLKAEAGASASQPTGVYTANLVVTVTDNP